MTVRLTHRQKPDTQNYIFQALGGPFSLTGIAASLRTGFRMSVPDKIPYIYTGYSASVSKLPPVWGTMSAYQITEGVAVAAQALPVTVPNGGSPTITVAWHSSSVPSTKPAWVTLTSGTTPTIAFTGTQVDADDVSSMVLSATANGTTQLSTGVSITVSTVLPTGLSVTNFASDLGNGLIPDMYYASSWVAPDGMIIQACTGNHGHWEDNSVRAYDPATGANEVAIYPSNAQPAYPYAPYGTATDWTQYDNLIQLYSARCDALIIVPRGVFVRQAGTYAGVVEPGSNQWIIGNAVLDARTDPTTSVWKNSRRVIGSGANDFIRDGGITTTWVTGTASVYNPHAAWSVDHDCGILIGGYPGGASYATKMWIIVRATNINASYTQEYYIMEKDVSALVSGAEVFKGRARDGCCFLGEYFYWVGGTDKNDAHTKTFFRMKITPHLYSTSASLNIERLTDCPVMASPYPMLAPDRYNNGLICITQNGVYLYDVTTATWSGDVTPIAYRAEYSDSAFAGLLPANVIGGFVDDRAGNKLRRVYFRPGLTNGRGTYAGDTKEMVYRSLKIGRGGSRWRSTPLPANSSPFAGYYEFGYGQNKHVTLAWHPKHRRAYNCGGDYGYGSANFGQPEGGSNNTTNAPSGARTYTWTDSLRMDMYSFDPYDTNKGWRLEHPYYPQNIGGSPEDKPAYPDATGWVYDPVRNKFWNFQNHIRDDQSGIPRYLADGVTLDPWANGTMFDNGGVGLGVGLPWEVQGTYSWTPNPNPGVAYPGGSYGNYGRWVKETNNYVWGHPTYTTPTVVGTCLRVDCTSTHGYVSRWAHYAGDGSAGSDRFVCLTPADSGRFFLFIFNPTTLTYEWRELNLGGAYQYVLGTMAYVTVIGDYVYTPVCTQLAGGGTRGSKIFRCNVTTALTQSNGALLSSSYWSAFDAPFTFAPNAEWESSGNASANWAAEVGLCAIDTKLVLIGSYGDVGIVVGGTTRLASYETSTSGPWVMAESFTTNADLRTWIALPDSGEIMMIPSRTASQSNMWFYRVR